MKSGLGASYCAGVTAPFTPECYPLTWVNNFGTAEQKAAALALKAPDVAYPPMPLPKPPGAPSGSALTTPPAGWADATATVDQVLYNSWYDTHDLFQNYFDQVAAGVDNAEKASPNTSWLAPLLAAGAGLAALLYMRRN